MAAFYQPKLDLTTMKNLLVVKNLAAEHPAYWYETKYGPDVEATFNLIFGARGRVVQEPVKSVAQSNKARGSWEFLSQEVQTLYDDLKDSKRGAAQDGDEMAYFRTATALLEKLVGLEERALNLKAISDFHSKVMEIMESVLSPTQRTEVMAQLEAAVKG